MIGGMRPEWQKPPLAEIKQRMQHALGEELGERMFKSMGKSLVENARRVIQEERKEPTPKEPTPRVFIAEHARELAKAAGVFGIDEMGRLSVLKRLKEAANHLQVVVDGEGGLFCVAEALGCVRAAQREFFKVEPIPPYRPPAPTVEKPAERPMDAATRATLEVVEARWVHQQHLQPTHLQEALIAVTTALAKDGELRHKARSSPLPKPRG